MNRRSERGFSLTELLLVVLIMGILAGVAVAGAMQFGSGDTCRADARMLRNAEATFFVANGRYGTQAELVSQGLVSRASTLHDITPSGLSYTVTELGRCVGSGTADADAANVVLPTTTPGLSVLVTGTDGTPVPFVQAEYRQGGGAWRVLGNTDAKGLANAPVPAGTYDVRVVLYGATSTVTDVEVGVGTLVYVSTVSLTGQLLSFDGSQVTGLMFAARSSAGGDWFSFGPTGRSGATVAVLPGSYDVQLIYNGVVATKADQSVTASTTVTFRSAPLTVKVITKYGNGVEGVVVTIQPDGGPSLPDVTTDSAGEATVEVLAASYTITGVYTIPGGTQTHTVTLDSVPTGAQPTVVELKANR